MLDRRVIIVNTRTAHALHIIALIGDRCSPCSAAHTSNSVHIASTSHSYSYLDIMLALFYQFYILTSIGPVDAVKKACDKVS